MSRLIAGWFLFLFSFHSVAQDFPEKWKKLLKEIVEINSSTSNPEGLEEVRKKLIPEFKALGYELRSVSLADGHKVLFFSYPSTSPRILLVGHIDTVFLKGSNFNQFSETLETFNGPGVNDMKGGIVMMLMILSELKDPKLLSQIAIVLNDDEEIGSTYSAQTLKELATGIPYGLIYEPTLTSSEHVTTTQAGVEWLELKVKGQAAHAGAEHDKGINACVELAHKIIQISRLTNYKKKLTVNPGVISGGSKANVVCEEASVKMDVRYVEEADLKSFRQKLDQIVIKDQTYNKLLKRGTKSELLQLVHIPSLNRQSTEYLFKKAILVGKGMRINLKPEHMGGASDANQLAPTGMKLLAGLGPYGHAPHTNNESLDLKSFEQRKKMSVQLIKSILDFIDGAN